MGLEGVCPLPCQCQCLLCVFYLQIIIHIHIAMYDYTHIQCTSMADCIQSIIGGDNSATVSMELDCLKGGQSRASDCKSKLGSEMKVI